MFYTMSDIHGCYEELLEALTHWDDKSETLVVLGDLIDRGPDSLKVIQLLKYLKESHGEKVIILKGNHDESFVNWLLDTPEEELGFYYMTSHEETIRSFYGQAPGNEQKFKRDSRKQRAQHIRHLFMKELRFLNDLPMYHETDNCVFVHAGINLNIEDWRNDEACMNHIRSPFIYSSVEAPKRTFFGHTPTALIVDDEGDYSVWDNGDKVGIDGGVVFGGQLNALKISEEGDIMQKIAIPKKERVSHGI